MREREIREYQGKRIGKETIHRKSKKKFGEWEKMDLELDLICQVTIFRGNFSRNHHIPPSLEFSVIYI